MENGLGFSMSLGTAPSTMRRTKQAKARALESFSSNQTAKVEASLAKIAKKGRLLRESKALWAT